MDQISQVNVRDALTVLINAVEGNIINQIQNAINGIERTGDTAIRKPVDVEFNTTSRWQTKAERSAERALTNTGKRSAEDINAVCVELRAWIAKNPGERIEAAQKALGISHKDIVLPVTKLLAAKQIRKRGTRRATRYYPT